MTIASSDEKHPDRFPAFSLLVCVLAVLAALALFYAPIRAKLDRFEYWTADWRTLLLADRTASQHPGIVLVVFDPATFDGGVVSPIPRDTHAQILRTIDAMGPKAIGLDFYFVASQGADKDGAMLAALHEIKTPIVLGAIDAHTTEFDEHQRAYQEKFLADAGRPAGYLALKYDPGHIVRRTSPPLPQSPFQESFSRQVASAAGAPLAGPGTPRRHPCASRGSSAPTATPSRSSRSPPRTCCRRDEARRAEIAQRVKGNIVLTGIDMPNSDRHDTALSVWTDDKMLGVMVHAHILAQLLDGRYFTELDGRARTAWLASVGLVGLVLGWSLRRTARGIPQLRVGHRRSSSPSMRLCYSGLRIVLPFALTLYRVAHRRDGSASTCASSPGGRRRARAMLRPRPPDALRASRSIRKRIETGRGTRRTRAPACGAGCCGPGARRRAPRTRSTARRSTMPTRLTKPTDSGGRPGSPHPAQANPMTPGSAISGPMPLAVATADRIGLAVERQAAVPRTSRRRCSSASR